MFGLDINSDNHQIITSLGLIDAADDAGVNLPFNAYDIRDVLKRGMLPDASPETVQFSRAVAYLIPFAGCGRLAQVIEAIGKLKVEIPDGFWGPEGKPEPAN